MRESLRKNPARREPERTKAGVLSALFALTGTLHLVRPSVFDPIVPRILPGPSRFWTLVSGFGELALAVLIAHRPTRSLGGLLAAVFLVAVFPANLRTVRIVRKKSWPVRLTALVRLPLQLPLIALALAVGRGA